MKNKEYKSEELSLKSTELKVVHKFFRKLFIDEVSELLRDGKYPNVQEWEEENMIYDDVVKPRLFNSAKNGGKLIWMMRNYVEEMWDNGDLWGDDGDLKKI